MQLVNSLSWKSWFIFISIFILNDDSWICCTGEAEKRILIDTTYDIKSCIDAQEDSLDKSIGTSCLIGDEVFLTIKER